MSDREIVTGMVINIMVYKIDFEGIKRSCIMEVLRKEA
jgi:hypothetical protein